MPNPTRSPLALTVLLALSGCAATQDEGGPPGAGLPVEPPQILFESTLVDTTYGATEPSIVVAPDGTIWIAGPTGFVTPAARGDPEPYTHDSGLWSSADGGKTWRFNEPIPGYGRDACPGGGDSDIAAAPDGSLYLIDLYLGNVVIDVSTDGGRNWMCNPITSAVPIDDRQWVEVYKDEAVYLMFNQIPTGILVLKATRSGLPTDGLVFEQQTKVNGASGGNFAVDQRDGTVYLAGSGNRIWVSADGGKTFAAKETPLGSDLQDFRTVTVDAAGAVYVVSAAERGVAVTYSKDKGATWAPRTVYAPWAGEYRFAWSAAGGDGVLNLAWYGRPKAAPEGGEGYYPYVAQTTDLTSAGAGATFSLARLTDRPVLTVDICMGLGCGEGRALGDFFEIGLDREGNTVVAYNDAVNHGSLALLFAKQTAGPKAALPGNATAAP